MRQDQQTEPRLNWRDKPLQTIKAAGEIINASRPTLYKLAREGRLTFRRLSARRTMVETGSIIAYLDSATPWHPTGHDGANSTAGGAS